jgi:hypothetical protein
MTIQFIAPPLTHRHAVIAKTTRFCVIKVEPTDEHHLRIDGWNYVVYDKRADHQYLMAYAKLEKGAFQGSLFVNAQHAWPVKGETAKDLI